MSDNELQITKMTLEEMHFAIEYAGREGWNPGLGDAASFYAADPEGFLIGKVKDEFVGCVSAVRYGDHYGFLGFYIVVPELRGRGFGLQLSAAGLGQLEGRSMGLDGVLAQQDNYRTMGFEVAYRNIRYEGSGLGDPGAGESLRPVADVSFDELSAYDATMFGVSRKAFLKPWIAQPDSVGFAIVDRGKIQGYGVIRPCYTGWKIGPLFADTVEQAETLLDALMGQAGAGEPVYFDTPEVNPAAVGMAEARGMQRVFETARMYKGQAPSIPLDRLYGVTSFELG